MIDCTNLPINIRQFIRGYMYPNSYYIKLNDEPVFLNVLSKYSCNIVHINDNATNISEAYTVEYVEDINMDERFNDLYKSSYEPIFSLDISFNKDYFTVGEIYSINHRLCKLIEFYEDKLIVEPLVRKKDEDVVVEILITILSIPTRIMDWNIRDEVREMERVRWWNNLFTAINKVSEITYSEDSDRLIDASLVHKPVIYEHKPLDAKSSNELVKIKYLFRDDTLLKIENIFNENEHILSYEYAIEHLKPVASICDNEFKYDNLEPIHYISGKQFSIDATHVIFLWKHEDKNYETYFSNFKNKIYFTSQIDVDVFPNMIINAYALDVLDEAEVPKYSSEEFYKLWGYLETHFDPLTP